jgi:serine/threonine protein kinase
MADPQKKSGAHDATQIVPLPGRQGGAAPAQGDENAEGAGRMVGEFRLLRRLGKGGMAEVWLAEQTSLKRNVALKFLKPELNSDNTYIRRFETEAKAAAGLNHPNIVQVYSTGVDDGHHFIAQEYVNGQTLRALFQKRGPLDLSLALVIMRQTAAALQAASERGIVHRDIKPENIMITRKGEVKVADFGLAQVNLGGEKLHLTQEGTTMGTPLYMSPEQVHGKSLDQRSDIYSFGVTVYHMLAGKPPFNGDSPVAVAVQHVNNEPPPLAQARPDLPKQVCELVHRMMAKKPEDRYASSQECLNDIRRLAKALKDTGNVNDVQLASLGTSSGIDIPSGLLGRRPGLTVTLCALMALLGGAAWGFARRVHLPESSGPPYTKAPTARDQFINAMLRVDDEEAWRAVKHWYPQEKLWVTKANEQLGLLYLRDPRRYDAADQIFREMQREQANGPDGERLYVEGTIGLAALHAYKGQVSSARSELSRIQDRADKISPSWNQLRREIESHVNAGGPRQPAPPPPGPPPPRSEDSNR